MVLSASREIHRAIVAWDTRTAEHRAVYAHPTAICIGQFLRRRPLGALHFRGSRPPAAHVGRPFRGLQNVPPAEWVDLGPGDYPCWSPAAGRIYFTHERNGYECIFTRAVDPPPSGRWVRQRGAPFRGTADAAELVAGRLPHLRGPRQAGLRAGRAGAPASAEAVTERTRRGSVRFSLISVGGQCPHRPHRRAEARDCRARALTRAECPHPPVAPTVPRRCFRNRSMDP